MNRRRAALPAVALAVGGLLGACAPRIAAAQTQAPSAAQQLTLQQVALGKARTELLARLRALPVAKATVGDWLASNVDLDRAARLWVRGVPAHGPTRAYSDGVYEVDVRVEPDELRDRLLALAEEHSAPDDKTAPADIKSAARHWPPLWVTGRAVLAEHALGDRPPGWENVSAEGLELARGAAEADAFHALAEEIGKLKVSSTRRVREFLDAGDAVRTSVANAVRREAAARIEFEPDQIASARVRIGVREVVRILLRVHEELYDGAEFEAADFREIPLLPR